MLRNAVFLHAGQHPNHDVGVLINGVYVEVEGVHESADPCAIVLELDAEALAEALSVGEGQ